VFFIETMEEYAGGIASAATEKFIPAKFYL
jgi:hypothetical protein